MAARALEATVVVAGGAITLFLLRSWYIRGRGGGRLAMDEPSTPSSSYVPTAEQKERYRATSNHNRRLERARRHEVAKMAAATAAATTAVSPEVVLLQPSQQLQSTLNPGYCCLG